MGKYKHKCLNDKWIEQSRVLCKCGHVINFFNKIPYLECLHCGNLVFRNKKCEYDFKIKRRMGV